MRKFVPHHEIDNTKLQRIIHEDEWVILTFGDGTYTSFTICEIWIENSPIDIVKVDNKILISYGVLTKEELDQYYKNSKQEQKEERRKQYEELKKEFE